MIHRGLHDTQGAASQVQGGAYRHLANKHVSEICCAPLLFSFCIKKDFLDKNMLCPKQKCQMVIEVWVPEALQLGNQRSRQDLSFLNSPDIKHWDLDPTIDVSGQKGQHMFNHMLKLKQVLQRLVF